MTIEHEIARQWLQDNPPLEPTVPEGWEWKVGRLGRFRHVPFDEATNKKVKSRYQEGDEIWLGVGYDWASVILIREDAMVMEDPLICV